MIAKHMITTKKFDSKKISRMMFLSTASAALMILAGCTGYPKLKTLKDDGHYWQRTGTSSAIYLRGPKAQQTLNVDISQCVVEINELKRLGAIGDAIPADQNEDQALEALSGFETPDRIGFNRREYLRYHDFEGCMYAKGWERIAYVPYDVARESIDNFTKIHAAYEEIENPHESKSRNYTDLNNE